MREYEYIGIKNRVKFLSVFVISVIVVLLIGFYAEGWFWRGFLSDVTIIVLLFSFIQSIVLKSSWKISLAVLVFSFGVEIAQYYHFVDLFGIENKVIRIIIGNHFDWLDLLAYSIGFVICLVIGNIQTNDSSNTSAQLK